MENTYKTELLMKEGSDMIELVERGALLSALSNSPNFSGCHIGYYFDGVRDEHKTCIEAIKNVPIAESSSLFMQMLIDQRNELREQIFKNEAKFLIDYLGTAICSRCRNFADTTKPYCADCGAKMIMEEKI